MAYSVFLALNVAFAALNAAMWVQVRLPFSLVAMGINIGVAMMLAPHVVAGIVQGGAS